MTFQGKEHVYIYSTANERHSFTPSFYLIKIMFYFLRSKQIFQWMAIGFAAFSCKNVLCRINKHAYICQKSYNHKILAKCVKIEFSMLFYFSM